MLTSVVANARGSVDRGDLLRRSQCSSDFADPIGSYGFRSARADGEGPRGNTKGYFCRMYHLTFFFFCAVVFRRCFCEVERVGAEMFSPGSQVHVLPTPLTNEDRSRMQQRFPGRASPSAPRCRMAVTVSDRIRRSAPRFGFGVDAVRGWSDIDLDH